MIKTYRTKPRETVQVGLRGENVERSAAFPRQLPVTFKTKEILYFI